MRQEDILGHARGLVFAIVSARARANKLLLYRCHRSVDDSFASDTAKDFTGSASRLFLILVCFGGG